MWQCSTIVWSLKGWLVKGPGSERGGQEIRTKNGAAVGVKPVWPAVCSLGKCREDTGLRRSSLLDVPSWGRPRQVTTWSLCSRQLPSLYGVPPCNQLLGLALPLAWSVTSITPGNQPCSRKCLMRSEGWGKSSFDSQGVRCQDMLDSRADKAPSSYGSCLPGVENGTLLWTPKSLEPFTLEILARNVKDNLSSVLQPKTVVCACKGEKQCLYNQTSWVGNSSLEVSAGTRVGGRFSC